MGQGRRSCRRSARRATGRRARVGRQPPEQLRNEVHQRIAHCRHPAAAAGPGHSPVSRSQPNADVVTSLPGLAGASGVEFACCEKFVPIGPVGNGNFNCTKNGVLKHPVIQALAALPTGVHAPNTLITEHAVHELGISSSAIGPPIGWFVNAAEPFTAGRDPQCSGSRGDGKLEHRDQERRTDVFDSHQLGHLLRHRDRALHPGDERRADPQRDRQRPTDPRRDRSEQLHPSDADRRHRRSTRAGSGRSSAPSPATSASSVGCEATP